MLSGVTIGAVLLVAATLDPAQRGWYGSRLGLTQPAYMAAPATPPAVQPVAEAILTWERLRQSDSYPFYDYANFLRQHPGWPGETGMRRAAEYALNNPASTPAPADIVAFFRLYPPQSAGARLRYGEALQALGQLDAAKAQVRVAWADANLSPSDEMRLLARFGSVLTTNDHDARMDQLLWARSTASALRQLPATSIARRSVFETRLALQTRAPDAISRVTALSSDEPRDAGLLADHVRWLRDTIQPVQARQLLATTPIAPVAVTAPVTWQKLRLEFAQASLNDKQYDLAYRIAGGGPAYAAGTAVRDKPLAERDVYTSLQWMAGWVALKNLGRPADAVRYFQAYAAAAQTPQTQSKGDYWTGRAAEDARQTEVARTAFARAAQHPDQFYGQLAAEKLDLPIVLPPRSLTQPSPAARAAFDRDEVVIATRILGELGDRSRQSLFVRTLAERAVDPDQRVLAVQLGKELNRPDLGVQVARTARRDGAFDLADAGYPSLPLRQSLGPGWTMVHAITRQESLFNREAVSRVNARGLMQLMPATAQQTAGKLGLPYDFQRLTADIDYNVMLGSYYFSSLMDYYSGSYVLAVAAYNGGMGNVNRWIREKGDPRLPGVDVIDWIEAIPLSETRGYVQRVLENAVVYDVLNPDKARITAKHRMSGYLGRRSAG